MKEIDIVDPVACPNAFSLDTDEALVSRAAMLLILSIAMSGRCTPELMDEFTKHPFYLPKSLQLYDRFHSREIYAKLKGGGFNPNKLKWKTEYSSLASKYVNNVCLSYTVDLNIDIACLIAMHLNHSNDLIRVSSAISWYFLSDEPSKMISIIEKIRKSKDTLAREMSHVFCSYISPSPDKVDSTSNLIVNTAGYYDCILVHGTSRIRGIPVSRLKWIKPGRNSLCNYLANSTILHPYINHDRFSWNGNYSHNSRVDASMELAVWINGHPSNNVNIVAHSHGGNIAIIASQHRQFRNMLLLSCPVWEDVYKPVYQNIKNIISIRVKHDLVLYVDSLSRLGGICVQEFSDKNIKEDILPRFFNHFIVLKPEVWMDYLLLRYVV